MIRRIITILLCLFAHNCWSQGFTETSTDLGFSFGFDAPLADLKDRFGVMYGGDFSLNFYRGELGTQFGLKLGFLTSDKVKEDPLAAYRNSKGQLLNSDGFPAQVNYRMAASYVGIDFKKNLGFISKNENAKVFIGIGTGIMQHKISFTEFSKSVPLAFNDYAKGHSRNVRGFYLEEQIGLKFRNNAKKFDISLVIFEGFLKPVGLIEFDTLDDLQTQRLDVAAGLKVAWYISLTSKQVGKDTYY